jgi:hypothetical protein
VFIPSLEQVKLFDLHSVFIKEKDLEIWVRDEGIAGTATAYNFSNSQKNSFPPTNIKKVIVLVSIDRRKAFGLLGKEIEAFK